MGDFFISNMITKLSEVPNFTATSRSRDAAATFPPTAATHASAAAAASLPALW